MDNNEQKSIYVTNEDKANLRKDELKAARMRKIFKLAIAVITGVVGISAITINPALTGISAIGFSAIIGSLMAGTKKSRNLDREALRSKIYENMVAEVTRQKEKGMSIEQIRENLNRAVDNGFISQEEVDYIIEEGYERGKTI